jgi:predicted PurR-regulated permease PerM
MGLLMTMAIGVASVLIAGMLINGFLGFIVAVVVGVLLVALWSRFVEPRRAPGWRQKLGMD